MTFDKSHRCPLQASFQHFPHSFQLFHIVKLYHNTVFQHFNNFLTKFSTRNFSFFHVITYNYFCFQLFHILYYYYYNKLLKYMRACAFFVRACIIYKITSWTPKITSWIPKMNVRQVPALLGTWRTDTKLDFARGFA